MKLFARSARATTTVTYCLTAFTPQKLVNTIMRLTIATAILLCTSVQFLSASMSKAQSLSQLEVTLQAGTSSPLKVLEQIEQITSFRFIYRKDQLQAVKSVKIPAGKYNVERLLELLFPPNEFQLKQLNGVNIAILPVTAGPEALADIRISGMVNDETGRPIPGVSVRVKEDRSRSTATDQNGHYNIDVDDKVKSTLIFSYIGYRTQEVVVGNQTSISITLEPSVGKLEEVQVIGYGTTTRRMNTGSVGSITNEVIEKQTVANPIQALAGRISGMTVVQNNGLPGSNSTVTIRGNNTLGANGLSGALPLYVVDGVPFTNFNSGIPVTDNLNSFGLTGANGGLSVFGLISPQDIERIDVLKDADATAIYGARGANGVIMITTKQGKKGKTSLGANVYVGAGRVGRFIEMLNTDQYLTLRREAFNNDGVVPNTTNAPDLLTWDQNAYTDWQDLLIGGTANVSDAQLNYSGGNDRINFFSSLNYRRETTVYPGDMGSKRINGRLNVQTRSADNAFTTSFSVNYANDRTNLIASDISSALSLPPNYPLYNPDGTLYWGSNFTNPYANLLKKYNSDNSNFIANGDLKYTLLEGLNLKMNLGYTRTTVIQNTQNPISSQNPTSTGRNNSAAFANTLATNYIIEPQVDYSLKVHRSSFNFLAGTSFQENVSDANRVNGSNYAFEAMLNTINGAGTVTSTNNYSIYKFASLFGRINYDLDKKYILNLTYRRDASSRFGPNFQEANFGALGAAWIFSDEDFIKSKVGFLSFGKLRASYGTTGNDILPNYSYLSRFNAGAQYQGQSTLALNGVANPNLKWETTRKLEFGVDLGFLKDRILFKMDAYWHRSTDLLTYADLQTATGFNSININLDALVQNRGLEFELESTNINSNNFKWNTSFNISFQRNKLLSFDQQSTAFYGSSFEIGYPVSLQRLFQFNGVDPTSGAALYQDFDGNSGLDFTADRFNASPGSPFFGGINNAFTYKNVSLDVFLQFNHSRGTTNQIFGTRIGSLNNQNASALNRWVNPGDEGTLFPGASANAGGAIYSTYNTFGQSSFFYGDNSWMKLRSASLSYTLPKDWLTKIKLSNARVYLQGQNLLTMAKNKYVLDPESANSLQFANTLPPLRTIVFGLNLTL
ncbi:SusC/RagA family TonB-linked outer membrane protein [Pedobacter deserti]|uniref:SusC/RagA family TonB-linked outer membrane protein n=1 Tax=Pedobacter deserti TaxID=2817382 RepID=UPI00210C236A|nr:SusC/RagA family TonB-linked outer membrane protein [Pedobacter sp. SYSU D00382]